MRKYALALLAVPVLAVVYVSSLLRTSPFARGGVAITLGAVIAFGAIAMVRPTATKASPPTQIVPLTQAAFKTAIATDVAVGAPATIAFSTPMDRASVQAALRVQPATRISLTWNADDTSVTIVPVDHWAPGTYHTITVESGALARTGRPSTAPARASFLTRDAATALVKPTKTVGQRVPVDTGFAVVVDGQLDPASLPDAIRLDPPVDGVVTTEAADGATRLLFTPTEPLQPDRAYDVVIAGVRDADGVVLEPTTLKVTTLAAPSVVRFRPMTGAHDAPREQVISVRFTRAMDLESTTSAFTVTVDDQPIKGTISFAEGDTVLVFDPAEDMPFDSKVVASVAASAQGVDGSALSEASRSAFRTVQKPPPPAPPAKPPAKAPTADTPAPTPAPTAPPADSPATGGGTDPGGGSVGSGSWSSVERYYLGLMNCTRTGGWVTSGGDCSSPGGRDVAPLQLSDGISDDVSRPYARLLATRGICNHFIGGNPGDRLRRAGYDNYVWAENLGCRTGSPTGSVLGTHLFYQSEKPYSGGHYVNLMSPKYDRVGIGVWVSSGQVRLVIDFYHP